MSDFIMAALPLAVVGIALVGMLSGMVIGMCFEKKHE